MRSEAAQWEGALGALFELNALMNMDMARGMTSLGLTPSRAHVVWELAAGGASTQRELADLLRVSPRNITGLVDALVQTGFVARRSHPTDRRATLVTLTVQGQQAADRMRADHARYAELLFAGQPPTRFRAFAVTLDHIVAQLRSSLEADLQ